jgi:tRNA G18 (ribose-2'-O)-methylase SpoU
MANEEGETTDAPARLRRAEAILQSRTGRIAIVLERITDSHNHSAVLRSVEAMGIQNVFIVDPPVARNESCKPLAFAKKITKDCYKWLTVRSFSTTTECISALKEDGYEIWATDLSQKSINMDKEKHLLKPFPSKVAIVIGRESDGVSSELLEVANKRIFIPMYGFTESFNLSVACALVVQRAFDLCPEAHGDLSEDERSALRSSWFEELTRNPSNRLHSFSAYRFASFSFFCILFQ